MLFKRVGLPVLAVLVAVVLVASVDRLSPRAAFAAPPVDVTLSAPAQMPIQIGPVAPGDTGRAGPFRVRYEGNATAWVGLDTDLVGSLAGGALPLTVTISDGKTGFVARGDNQVLGLFQPGEQVDLEVQYSFPLDAGNVYQAQSAELYLQVHAVEADQNTRYVNGIPMGPVTWTRRLAGTQLAGTEITDTVPSTEPCTGPDCSPSTNGQTSTEAPGVKEVQPTVPVDLSALSGACCQCVRPILWLGLLYALLLILAMLASFYLGWRFSGRRRYLRHKLRRRPKVGENPAHKA